MELRKGTASNVTAMDSQLTGIVADEKHLEPSIQVRYPVKRVGGDYLPEKMVTKTHQVCDRWVFDAHGQGATRVCQTGWKTMLGVASLLQRATLGKSSAKLKLGMPCLGYMMFPYSSMQWESVVFSLRRLPQFACCSVSVRYQLMQVAQSG